MSKKPNKTSPVVGDVPILVGYKVETGPFKTPLLSVNIFPDIPKVDNDGVVGVPEVK